MVYLIFYDFLYPMLGIQITTLVSALAKNDDQWRNLFALQSVKLSEVFTIFVIHQAFLKNGLDLVVASKYLLSKTKSLFAETTIEKQLAFESEPFRFDFELAVSLNTLIIFCSFSIINLIIIVPGILFLVLE